MDQSLDSIIKEKRQEKRATPRARPATADKKTFKSSGGGGRGGSKARGGASTAAATAAAQRKPVVVRRQQQPREQPRDPPRREQAGARPGSRGQGGSSGGSIFDRLGDSSSGGGGRTQASGTKVEICGLTKAVTTADITQLCESIGEVKTVSKKFDTAEVWFERRSHAVSAVKKFNGLTLDGVPMSVALAGERGRSNPFDPNDAGAQENREGARRGGQGGRGNVRDGLFGTRGDSAPAINFGYNKPAAAREQRITVTINNRERNDRGAKGGSRGGRGEDGAKGGKGSGGGGGGRGAKRPARQAEAPKTQAELDREMDEYLAAR